MRKNFAKIISITLAAGMAAASLAGCSGQPKGDETALVVNGEEIPYGTANFVFRHDQAYTMYYMSMLGMASEDFWSQTDSSTATSSDSSSTSSSTKTYADTFKDTEYSSIVRMYAVKQKAINEYGIEITDDELAKIDEAVDAFIEANPDAEETFGTTREQLVELFKLYTYSYDIKDSLTGDVDRDVSDDEAAQSRCIYARIEKNDEDEEAAAVAAEEEAGSETAETSETSTVSTSETSTSSTSETSEEAEETTYTNAELKEQAENVLLYLQATDASEDDVTVDELNDVADTVNSDFYVAEYTYGADDDSFEDGVLDVLNSLDDNTWYDGVIETDNYYYMVKMVNQFDEEATEQEKKEIITERENDAIDEYFTQWESEAEVETKAAWDNLVIKSNENYTMTSEY